MLMMLPPCGSKPLWGLLSRVCSSLCSPSGWVAIGPDYIQYGKDGYVRYELAALMAYRAAHRVETGGKP